MELIQSGNIWLICLGLALLPFIQEDLAVATAAGVSVSNPTLFLYVFPAILGGLIISDVWKYGLGVLGRTRKWAMRYAQKPKVAIAKEKMRNHPGTALMAVRFIPLARVPAYIAAGFVRVPYAKFCGWITVSAFIYVSIIFGIFHALGEFMGEHVVKFLPIIGITIIALMTMTYFARKRWRKA